MAQERKNTTTSKQLKKVTKAVPKGRIYVTATFNTTMVSVTDDVGNVICWSTAGEAGFSGSRKSTPYAATITVENAVNKARAFGMNTVDVFIKGPGPGRDVTLRVLRAQGIRVSMIADMTPDPHNGTRPRKAKHNK
ncbi:MAG: 30S ribosomal protein S11 [Candidatus Pacebacteria bacterium CG_4_10_14_3_um_filter_34_15]|nr:30S ribosomal protein S11 [Candidatus Pacearchaeota archaeon]NCQ65271.1 30S ribosomal protein S11 [Candidatus Paceibacterota bacterium]OIO45004.1 MAG: 30S ribosomal protein S11 [Candidatus Pacebacteria bacterium CG1_02_43_31]PIQ81050.1 MAG: 30S ribosomal protein S11 [Candidatus Pacebacteria bacterium CG11_big_fil_rev_8_21_14_0_20_34_55]PIX81867.1 MAG: 30S ribosomal protein S11 [Candidatus Pacebacteria bacterium CG_4_10_14_3_um_filter_34_15]PJC44082.1 MAG: 30S ribosomal protein S11 [Candidat